MSLKHFFKILNVPNKLVLKTRVGFFLEASIAGSAQQSITRLNFGNELIFLSSQYYNYNF